MRVFWAPLAIIVVLSGCGPTYVMRPFQERASPYRFTGTGQEPFKFSYKGAPEDLRVKRLSGEETPQYEVFQIKIFWIMQGEEEKSFLEFKYYRSRLQGKKKTVIVLPIYSRNKTHEFLPLFLSYWLTIWNPYADFNLIHVKAGREDDPFDLDYLAEIDSEEKTLQWMRESVKRTRKIVTGIGSVLDWAEGEKDIDMKRIGMVGFSTSASICTIAAGVDRRISSTVFFAGGLNFQDILKNASEPRIKRIRELIKYGGHSPWPNFLIKAASILEPADPLLYASLLNPSKTLLFEAEYDEYVSKSARTEFWRVLGEPELITYSSGHRDSFLALTPLGLFSADRKIVDFFRKKL